MSDRVLSELVTRHLKLLNVAILFKRFGERASAVDAEVVPAEVEAADRGIGGEHGTKRGAPRRADAVVAQVNLSDAGVACQRLAKRLHASLKHADAVPLKTEERERAIMRQQRCECGGTVRADVTAAQVERLYAGIVTQEIIDHMTTLALAVAGGQYARTAVRAPAQDGTSSPMNVSLNATVSAPEAIISCIRVQCTMRTQSLARDQEHQRVR